MRTRGVSCGLIMILIALLTTHAQSSLLPGPVILLDAQQCPYAYDVYKDAVSEIILVACANSGVLAIAPNGTTSMILSQDLCWSPMSLHADPIRGMVYVFCHSPLTPSPTDATSFALSGPDFSRVTVVTTGAQCDWVNDLAWDSATNSLIIGCLGTQTGLYRLSSGGNLTLLVDGNTCESPACFAFIPPLLFMSCNPGPLPAFHLGEYNFETSRFTPVPGNDFCSMYSRPIVKNTSPVTLLAACDDNRIASITLSAGGPTVSNLTNSTQCDRPDALSLSSSGVFLYASCMFGGVSVVDLQSNTTTALLSSDQCPQPTGVFLDESSNNLYTTCVNGGLLSLSLSTTSRFSVSEN